MSLISLFNLIINSEEQKTENWILLLNELKENKEK